VPGSPDSLPILEALLGLPGLPNRAVAEEEDIGLMGLFWLSPTLRMFFCPLQVSLSLVGRSVYCL
jgi:hypothetical protein